MRDFIIVTPRYLQNSNGIKTLHKICNTINSIGGRARLAFIASNDPNCQDIVFRDQSWTKSEWNTPPLLESDKHQTDDAYVLYPEIIIGNPLNARRVIRYFGNREAYCNGKTITHSETDFRVAHSIATRKDAHCILFNSEINPAFDMQDAKPAHQRTLDATYIGKGYLYGQVGVVNNTLLIGREWPTPQEQLAILLRNVRVFHTWDSWTSTNVEAVLCGAVPYFMRYEPWTEEDLDGSEIGRIPRLDAKQQNYDPVKFEAERQAMKVKLDALVTSWDLRVRDFMFRVEKHFNERGLG